MFIMYNYCFSFIPICIFAFRYPIGIKTTICCIRYVHDLILINIYIFLN